MVGDGPLKAGGGDADLGDAVAHLRQGAAEQLLLISPRSRDGVLRGDVDGVGGGRDAGGRSIYVAAKRLQIVQVTLQLGVAGGQGIDGESQLLLVRIGVGHLIVHDLQLLDDGGVHVQHALGSICRGVHGALRTRYGVGGIGDRASRLRGDLGQHQVRVRHAGHGHRRERAQAVLQRQGKVAHLLQLVLHGLRVGTSLLKLALRRLRLLTGLLGGRRQPAHGRTRIGNRIDGARKLRGRAVLRGAQILFGLGDLIVERVRHHRADRGNELAVDSLIKGGGTRVGHLRRHGVHLLVNVILQVRLLEISRHNGEQVGGEVLGDDERRIHLARFHLAHRVVVIGELPFQLVVLMQRVHDLVAQVHLAHQVVLGSGVLIHHAYAHVSRIVIGVPKADDVEPRVR